jgi:hypothetical protein
MAKILIPHARSHTITSTSDHTANNWKIVYTNGSGQVIELALGADATVLTVALGADATVLTAEGASAAPTFGKILGESLDYDAILTVQVFS